MQCEVSTKVNANSECTTRVNGSACWPLVQAKTIGKQREKWATVAKLTESQRKRVRRRLKDAGSSGVLCTWLAWLTLALLSRQSLLVWLPNAQLALLSITPVAVPFPSLFGCQHTLCTMTDDDINILTQFPPICPFSWPALPPRRTLLALSIVHAAVQKSPTSRLTQFNVPLSSFP